jgi:phospholipid/cholesterol/gamma-HCH transport system permease protein
VSHALHHILYLRRAAVYLCPFMFVSLGHRSVGLVEGFGNAGYFLADSVRAVPDVRTWGRLTAQQMRRLGVDSLPIALFIAAFTGIVLALLASYVLTGAVPIYLVGTLVGKTIMMVIPRVLAGTVMFPVVVAFAMAMGVFTGWLAATTLLPITTPEFLRGLRLFFVPFDIQYGLIKSASFGFVISLIGCYLGLGARGGAEGVGNATTRTVVYSAEMILVLDAYWAVVLLRGA